MIKLSVLTLDNNEFTDLTTSLKSLTQLKSLFRFSISGNPLHEKFIKYIEAYGVLSLLADGKIF